MGTFAVTDPSQLLDATNYLLSNLGPDSFRTGGDVGNAVTINTQTGVIGQGGTVIGYFYQYLNIAYADSTDGSVNFSTSRFDDAQYFGVYNNAADPSPDLNNPARYQWTQITGGLSTNKFVYYSTLGGRQIQFIIATAIPGAGYVQATDNVAIDLDFVTNSASLPVIIATAFYDAANANIAPPTPTGGTYDFANLVFTAPVGWANSIPANNIAFFSSQNTFEATGNGIGTVGPSFAWTVPVLTGKIGQDGTNGANGANGANGTNGTNGSNGVSTYFYNVFLSANTQPGSPTGGFFNFSTATGTPPVGWSNTPTSPLGDPIWATSAQVSSTDPTANVSIGNTWSATFQYTGAGGAPGQRGFVPMAYVLTPSNPTTANSFTLSQWFQASTSGTPPGSNTPPVGTGYVPVSGDTASFTFSSNTAIAPVFTYDATTSIWSPAAGQVINGNVFVTGSVSSAKLNANDVYVLRLQSTNANIGNTSSNGFWLDSLSGNARMAGNVSIGNNLTVGNNAIIGNSLTIGGVLLNGNLVANVVTAGTIANNAVTAGTIAANAVTANTIAANAVIAGVIAANAVVAGTIAAGAVTTGTLATNLVISNDIVSSGATIGNISSPGYWLQGNSGNARFGGNVSIGSNLNVTGLITTGALQANTVITSTITANAVTQSSFNQTASQFAMDIYGAVSATFYYIGQMRATGVSSSGTTLTATGTAFTTSPYLPLSNVAMISGTGAFSAGTFINSVTNDTQLVLNQTPSTPLSGATITSIAPFQSGVSPYLYITTTASTDTVQVNFVGTALLDVDCTALESGVLAQVLLRYYIYRYQYSALGNPISSSQTLVYFGYQTTPQVYISGIQYNFASTLALPAILDQPGTPGTYVYVLAMRWSPFFGSWANANMSFFGSATSGTVLKR